MSVPIPPPLPVTRTAPPPLPPSRQAILSHQLPQVAYCPFCHGSLSFGVQKCRHCGEFLVPPSESNTLAGCLGVLLGPVGLWYKGLWGAGFAWLVMILLLVVGTGGLAAVFAPLFWIGMGVHAYVAKASR